MIDKFKIVEILGRERMVERMVENITHSSSPELSDLAQEIYLALLNYDNDKIVDLFVNEQINYFIARIVLNQFRSKTSPFHITYRKFQELSEDITDKDFIYGD